MDMYLLSADDQPRVTPIGGKYDNINNSEASYLRINIENKKLATSSIDNAMKLSSEKCMYTCTVFLNTHFKCHPFFILFQFQLLIINILCAGVLTLVWRQEVLMAIVIVE